MTIMNKKQIIAAFKAGLLDDVKKQLSAYGKIITVTDWEESEGFFREYTIAHHAILWDISMVNGEVKSVGHNFV